MINIAIFTPILYPFHIETAQTLKRHGIETKVFTHRIFGNYPFEEWLKYAEKIRPIEMLGTTAVNPLNLLNVVFKSFNPDIVVIFGCETLSSITLYTLTRLLRRIPIVIVEENNITRVRGLKRLLKIIKVFIVKTIYKSAPILVAESRATVKYILDILRVKRDVNSIYIRPHGVNTHKFKPMKRDVALKYIKEKYKLPLDKKKR